jgi:tetratricopeptide (TPR) repeat protein
MTRRHVGTLLSVLLCAIGLAVPAAADDSGWRQLKTARYTVLSQLSEGATRVWATEFDQFIDSTGGLLKVTPALLPPLTVVLMAREKDFDAYKPPRPNGSTAKNVSGFFYRTDGWSVVGLANSQENDETRHTIFHEAVHWLFSADRSAQPRWFSEGIAELFSTFNLRISKVEWAHPIGSHVQLLREHGLMPMKEFIAQDESLFDRDEHTGRYYAQSWALVHYLLMSNKPERRQMLVRFISAYKTKSADESFRIAFGGDYGALEKELHSYIDQPRMAYTSMPRMPAAPQGETTPAAPVQVELALGKLALQAADPKVAIRHADQAFTLAPTDPAAQELRAYIAMRDNHTAEAAAAAEKALSLGSRDSTMFILHGDALGNRDSPGPAERARQRASMYENAINLSPRTLETYERLASALLVVDRPTDDDAKFLDIGRQLFPQQGFIQLGLAQVAYRQGRRDDALRQLDTALATDMLGAQRSFARGLHDHWILDGLQDQVREQLPKRRYAEARAALEAAGPQLLEDDSREFAAQLRSSIELQQLSYDAQAAAREKRIPDARRLFEQLLARKDLPDDLRQFSERALKGLGSGNAKRGP